MIIHKANYSYLHVAIRQKTKFLIYVNHIYKFMVYMYYGFGYEREVRMKKRLFAVVLCLSVSVLACQAEDFNNVLRGIRSGIDALSDVNRLRGQVIQTNAQKEQLQQKQTQLNNHSENHVQQPTDTASMAKQKSLAEGNIKFEEAENLEKQEKYSDAIKAYESAYSLLLYGNDRAKADTALTKMQDLEQLVADRAAAAEEEQKRALRSTLFAGLKPESSLVDTINTFKNMSSVSKIELGYNECGGAYMQYCKFKTIGRNLKNTPSDATSILNSVGNLLSSTRRIPVELANGTGSMTVETLYLQISKIYIEGIPFDVEVTMKPLKAYYFTYPQKVLKGASGVGYPYAIGEIKMSTDLYDENSRNLVSAKGKTVEKAYEQKYGYENSDFVDVSLSINSMSIVYKNWTNLREIEEKYEEYITNKSVQQTQKYNSIDEI